MSERAGMKTASRTLVKSQPELWELIDQPERMQGLMCGLIGRATEVTVSERRPESVLRWQASEQDAEAWIEVELAEKGWGTNVKVKAENGDEPTKLEGWLDAVLEELATPQKRPFEGMDAPPEPVPSPPVESPKIETVPSEEPPAEEEPEESEEPEPEVETPVEPEPAETPAAKTAAPGPKEKLRRFFGL
jgi:hypothetical protein